MSSDATDVDIKSCANCGKGEEDSNKLKKCSACLLVKYCSAACQKAHRPQHKKICKQRAAELYDEKLFKEVEPEDCPLCFQPMPLDGDQTSVGTCCGKRICNGCIYGLVKSGGADICAFCRTPAAKSDEECIKRIKKLIDNGNAQAFHMLAGLYFEGGLLEGLPQDYQKANESNLKAGELGCAGGYLLLGDS